LRRKTVLGIMLTLLLLGTSTSIFLFSPSLAQPSEGDWDVIGMEVAENETIELSGNLTIKAGGSLTLRNVTLRMNVEHDGQYGISVEEGGALSIYNSNISSTTGFRFFFSVMVGSFVMKNSVLHDAGGGGGADWGGEPRKRGLYVQADDAVIDGNLIADCLGVFLCLCHNSSVTNNRLVTDYGITVTHNVPPFTPTPSNNTILNNTIQGAIEFGITIGVGNSNVVANNTILDAMVGIMMWDSRDNIVVNNHVSPEHHPDPWGGIVLWSWCGNNTIANNTVKTENPKGIIDGIEVFRSVNNRIEGNIVENLSGGITLSYSHNNVLASNNISNIWRGTDPMHSYSPSSDAIQLYHSSNNTIINNQISRVQSNAIILWDMSKNNVLQANVIDSSYNGIGLHYSSDNNTIANNEVGRIGSWTIVLDESNENIAYHNSFLDPIIEAYDDGMNYWNLEGHGNYWGDYEGQDIDGDGIGDASYHILPRGTDDFPLMNPEPATFVPIPILEEASPPLWPPDRPRATITTEETWKNTVVTMDGITVKNGGNLTLQNVTVMFCSDFSVEAGGSLYIYDSKITAADQNYGGFSFFVTKAKEFVMMNSVLSYSGFCYQTDFPGGLAVLATNATIENNTCVHNYRGIWVSSMLGWVQYPPFVTIANNTVSYSYDGIVYDTGDALGNTVSKIIHTGIFGSISGQWWRQYYFLANNSVTQVWTGAIMLSGTEGTWVTDNRISDSDIGILLLSSVNNARIADNTVSDAWRWAIEISPSESSSHGNILANNTILDCTKGIYLSPESNDTLLYRNNIINSPNSSDLGSNSWDYNSEGNYWSDYIGIDANGDGAGDAAYDISSNGVDRYPLIVPAVWNLSDPVPVNWQGTIYPVALSSNSTISTFKFNQLQKQISFDATGASDSIGYCNVTIPKTLLKDSPWTIAINNLPIADHTKTENDTHTSLYFTYTHASTSHIIIRGTSVVPEFPSIPTLPIFIILAMLLVLFARKKNPTNQTRSGRHENIERARNRAFTLAAIPLLAIKSIAP